MRLKISDADTEDLSVQKVPKHFSRSSVHLASAGSAWSPHLSLLDGMPGRGMGGR